MSAVIEANQLQGRECAGANCSARVTLKYGRYCDPCRANVRRKKKIYVSNDLIDAQIRRIYSERPDKKTQSAVSVKALARRINWPEWAIHKRAAALSVARVKDKPWSDKELAILERNAWLSPRRIKMKLAAAGFNRTETAIDVKLDRTYARRNTPYFTGRGLASLLGVDSHTITRWINRGYLKAKRRGTDRHEGNGGDMYMIHEKDFRAFVYARPMEIDLRKVDQLWFLDFITEGKICS